MTDKKQKKQSLPQESYQTIDDSMADNEVNNDAMLLDNAVDTELLSGENILSTELLSPDSSHDSPDNVVDISPLREDRQINNKVKVEIPDKLYVPELLERYNIKRASLYKHMEYLNISPWKEGNRAYLNAEQIGHMDGLSDHMENNKMETYPKPEPTGPKEKEHSTSPEQTASEDETSTVRTITVHSNNQQSPSSSELPNNLQLPGTQAVHPRLNDEEMKNIHIQAQIIAATRYYATQELADYYASTGNFNIPELNEIVSQRREKTAQQWQVENAVSDPKYITQLLIEQAKAYQVVGMQDQTQPAS